MTENGQRSPDKSKALEPKPEAPEVEAAEMGEYEDAGFPSAAPDPVAQLMTENAELKDRLLRSLADTENLRKRAEREKAEATLYAASNFARDLLSVPDNLARALAAVPAEAREKADDALKALISGIEVTERELLNTLQRHGIRRIHPLGEKFDPHFHQAMFETPAGDAAPGTVTQVVQPGYAIGERILRPAMVGVAKE